jgi:hypothetical protein
MSHVIMFASVRGDSGEHLLSTTRAQQDLPVSRLMIY